MKRIQNIKSPADQEHDYRFLIDSLEDYGVLMMDMKGHIIKDAFFPEGDAAFLNAENKG